MQKDECVLSYAGSSFEYLIQQCDTFWPTPYPLVTQTPGSIGDSTMYSFIFGNWEPFAQLPATIIIV
eukprot:scaffold9118_cov139-Skeletonema_dohrnii-CCMP3373.AAC.2